MTTAKPVALVTGASSGIGKSAAIALVDAGFEVVGTSRNTAGVAPLDGVTFLDLDVTSDESVSRVVGRVIERFGRIDVLVNNAGTGAAGAAEESSVAQDQRVFDINFFGLVRMTKAVLPHMRAAGTGRIVNVSSVVGLVPAPYMASYAATKHAIEGYSESVDHEVREHGIRVLLVEPAYTRTDFDAKAIQPDAPLPIYAEQRHVFDGVMARAMADGDDPAIVAKAIVAAATDPKPKLRYTDPIAQEYHVIAFDNRGVGASTGQVPDSVEAMADDAYTFIRALGFDTVDVFSFSLGGMVAQALVVKHPDLVRKLILTGTGPAGGRDIDKVAGTTYLDILRAALTRSDPKEFLFFNRNATGKPAARAFVNRLKEPTVDRDAPITVKALQTQLKAIKKWGRSAPADLSKITEPTLIANGDNDRMVPSVLSEDLHRRIPGSELIIFPDSGHGGIFQFHDKFAPIAVQFLDR